MSSALWRSSSAWVGWAALAVTSVMLLIKLRRAQPIARLSIAGFALASPAVFAFTMSQRSGRLAPALASLPYDTRYWVGPQLLLLVAFLVPPVVDRGLLLGSYCDGSVGSPIERERLGRWGVALSGGLPWIALSVITAAWLAVAVVPSYRHDVGRSEVPVLARRNRRRSGRVSCRPDSRQGARCVAARLASRDDVRRAGRGRLVGAWRAEERSLRIVPRRIGRIPRCA